MSIGKNPINPVTINRVGNGVGIRCSETEYLSKVVIKWSLVNITGIFNLKEESKANEQFIQEKRP
jgi:hypothetical protein